MKNSAAIATAAILLFAGGLSARAQEKISDDVVKLGLIEDMSSIYADITGLGAVTAAKMAAEDFGGKVLGKPIEIVSADHQNKADIASSTAREWFDLGHVDALMDVAASATALAAIDVAKAKNKIVMLSGPGAARITNEACTAISIHYAYDNYALSHGTGSAMVKAGYDSWFFLTADYAFGHDLEQNTAAVVKANGGQVLGDVRVPINTADFSSALLQAQASKAKVVGLANAGADTTNSIKQAAEFGLVRGGQKLAGLLIFVNDVNTLGLQTAQGMLLTNAFYWDRDDESRTWSRRYFQRMNRMPNMVQAGIYSATMHYLRAVAAANRHRIASARGRHYLHPGYARQRLDHGFDFLGTDEESAEPHGIAQPRLINEAGTIEAAEIAGAEHSVGGDRLFGCDGIFQIADKP